MTNSEQECRACGHKRHIGERCEATYEFAEYGKCNCNENAQFYWSDDKVPNGIFCSGCGKLLAIGDHEYEDNSDSGCYIYCPECHKKYVEKRMN